MLVIIKKVINGLLFYAIISTLSFAMEIKDLAQAVDVAGKQRMFTQRMLKDYAMVGMGNNFGNPQKDLEFIVGEFEDHLNSLISFNSDEATDKSLKDVQTLWKPIKDILKSPPKHDNVVMIQESLEELLKLANISTQLFAKQTGKESGEIINISGRQRMLSQRMASLYMLKVWGIDDPKFKDKMNQAMELFKSSSEKLMASDMSTPEIKKLLKESYKHFMFFQIMNKSSKKFIPSLIYKKSNQILKSMNSATGLYVIEENK